MDEPDDEGNKLKEVVGCGSSGIRHEEALVLGTNGNDGFDMLVISSSASVYNIRPVEGGGRGDKNE